MWTTWALLFLYLRQMASNANDDPYAQYNQQHGLHNQQGFRQPEGKITSAPPHLMRLNSW